ncbi:MAG TPA: HD domain-containing protein [Aggregatilineales bacterium]|nr:HD domain-containing protein [Anaerolineales bacterium]HRE47831.1 HD domain-containing protein [Aggregatilineales bacterium]
MTIHTPNFEGARAYALERLANELDPRLTYHHLGHTRDEVAAAVAVLANALNVEGERLMLLRTAAYFHDLGYLHSRLEHEMHSVFICREALPDFGYNVVQTEAIGTIIMATRLPHRPKDVLGEILADADLDSLGSAAFLSRSADLRRELETFNSPISDAMWYQIQIDFMEAHHYFTAPAIARNGAAKERHIALMRALLNEALEKDAAQKGAKEKEQS